MGSLVGGWDATRPGKAPKGFEDYKEPFTPRSRPQAASPFDAFASEEPEKRGCAPGSPPSLARVSAPPAIHGASAVQRYLSRSSSGAPSSPRASTPRAGTPRSASKHLTLRFGGDGDDELAFLGEKMKWCSHVDSAQLNLRPDVVDKEALHGGFKMDDPCHALHLPGSPLAAEAAAQAAMSPFTPTTEKVTVEQMRRVTATRMPKEATESFESAAL